MAELAIWTIYDHPADYPDNFVVRPTILKEGGVVEQNDDVHLASTLEEARSLLPPGLYPMHRHPFDDPVIVESWV